MKIPQCKIIIYKANSTITFTYCAEIYIENDWDSMTMKATVILPNKFQKEGKRVELEVERGNKIEIFLGYRPYLNKRFSGYIARINIGGPFKIDCEGLMWKLKQKVLRNFNVDNYTLKQYIEAIWQVTGLDKVPDKIDYDVSKTSSLGKIKYSGGTWTASELLQNLKDYGILTFQYGEKLKIGAPYTIITNNERREFTYYFNGQKGNITDSSLNYRNANDVKVVIEGESINSQTNERIVRYAYYDGDIIKISTESIEGNVIDKKFINLSVKELENRIKEILILNNYTGFSGSFTAFGLYPVQIGDIITLKNYKYPSYDGRYYMKGYEESLSVSEGYRHNIRLARKYN